MLLKFTLAAKHDNPAFNGMKLIGRLNIESNNTVNYGAIQGGRTEITNFTLTQKVTDDFVTRAANEVTSKDIPDRFLITPYSFSNTSVINMWGVNLIQKNVRGDGYCYVYSALSILTGCYIEDMDDV
jgi:hypothetical protein